MKLKIIIPFVILLANTSCKKYLDAKPDEALFVPSTPEDFQAILDNYSTMSSQYPSTAEALSDNFYMISTALSPLNEDTRNLYLWKKQDRFTGAWKYIPVFNTNVVLDGIAKNEKEAADPTRYNMAKGHALFVRATYFYALAQLYAYPYDKNNTTARYGIPLRLTSDYLIPSRRSSVEETYNRIVDDFKASLDLLPMTPVAKTRPCKPAVFGSLARTYLAMSEYALAEQYADSCLKYYSSLIDYNTLTATLNAPIQAFNAEVIFHIRSASTNDALLNPSSVRVDSNLYKSYATNDLRRTVFFKSAANNTFTFKGDYDNKGTSGFVFGGIVTDEQFLIRAECRARRGATEAAMEDLNKLLAARWKTNTFTKLTAPNADEALKIILQERRKELIGRGARWTDLRRLMNDPIGTTTPKRVYNNETFQLAPNSPRYTLPFPLEVIQKTGMEQNP